MEEFRTLILDMAIELDEIGIAVKSGKASVETPHLASRISELRARFVRYRDQHRNAENVEGFISLRHILESIEDIGDRLHTLHGYTTYDRQLSKSNQPPAVDYEQFITHQDIDKKLIFDNLSLRSNIFRHSLRVSIATIAGYIISGFLPVGHGYWILLTIIVILKPAYSLTKKRNFERLMGTLSGALVGLLILYFIHDRNILFVLMILFMIGTYVFIRTNYLICVTLTTPYVLLLFHLLYPTDFRTILSDRVIDTAIGSGLAFLANIFIVPFWEREQIGDYMVKVIEANAAYFRDVAGTLLGRPATITQYKLSRKHAFVALASLSDAFGRIMSEPHGKRGDTGLMHQFVVSCHMLTSHIATMAYYAIPNPEKVADPQLYRPVVSEIGARLENTTLWLKGQVAVGRDLSTPAANIAREDLRILNDRINKLVTLRKAELEKGIVDSETRKELSALKPIVDTFNFISKVSGNIERLSKELGSGR